MEETEELNEPDYDAEFDEELYREYQEANWYEYFHIY